jgi:hypothetical protein
MSVAEGTYFLCSHKESGQNLREPPADPGSPSQRALATGFGLGPVVGTIALSRLASTDHATHPHATHMWLACLARRPLLLKANSDKPR